MSENGELIRSTIDEMQPSKAVEASRVIERLKDWARRIDGLYDFLERTLGDRLVFDRSGEHRSQEELVQRAAVPPEQVPPVKILTIKNPDGTLRAIVQPRGLWVIGANGRLDLRIVGPGNTSRSPYILIDRSRPMSGQPGTWYIVDPADRTTQRPLTEEVVRNVIQHH
jgi:hypothetical protein